MELSQVLSSSAFDHAEVKSITEGVVYYVSTGRNAWHNTWIAQYTNGCMHSTLDSAKKYAEKKRTSGTVFYITQLPCIVFRSHKQVLLVTEINNKDPLSGYSSNAMTAEVAPDATKIVGALDNYIGTGAPLIGVALSFFPTSRFWKARPNTKNAIMLLTHSDKNISVEKKGLKNLRRYTSSSHGSNYYLFWHATESEIKPTAIRAIVKYKLKPSTTTGEDTTSVKNEIGITNQSDVNSSAATSINVFQKDKNQKILARLRTMSVTRGDPGSPAAREEAIKLFLDEFSEVLSYKVMDKISDAELRLHFVNWADAVISGVSPDDRIEWMAGCVTLRLRGFTLNA